MMLLEKYQMVKYLDKRVELAFDESRFNPASNLACEACLPQQRRLCGNVNDKLEFCVGYEHFLKSS